MLFLCEFSLRFMTCTMKFWIKYGLAFEFDTARIMKFSLVLYQQKMCGCSSFFMFQSSSFL